MYRDGHYDCAMTMLLYYNSHDDQDKMRNDDQACPHPPKAKNREAAPGLKAFCNIPCTIICARTDTCWDSHTQCQCVTHQFSMQFLNFSRDAIRFSLDLDLHVVWRGRQTRKDGERDIADETDED